MMTSSHPIKGAGSRGPERSTRGRRRGRFMIWMAVALVLVVGVVAALVIDTASDKPSGASIDQRAISFVEEQLKAQGSPASAFAVVREGEVTQSGTLGTGITVDTPFLLGSLSKSFTAMAVMQLVDDGVVSLRDPVTDHISWFSAADSSAVITVRQLLNQTSGLPTWAGTINLTDPDTTLEQRVRAIADVELVAEPGEEFHYCNKNYAALGLLVEEVSGMTFADYLQEHILDPLDMTNTFTSVADARRAGLTDGASIWFGAHVSAKPVDFPGVLPDGYVISSVADLARYVGAQRFGNHAGRQVISEESLRQMHEGELAFDDRGSRYAFGWVDAIVDGQRLIQHEGDLASFHANLGMLPDSALVVLTAHNSQVVDTSRPYVGGLSVLAGDSTPDVDRSFLYSQVAVSMAAVVELLLLAAGTIGLVRRIRRPRDSARSWWATVGRPGLLYLAASGGLAAATFFGLRFALRDVVVITPRFLFEWLPDLSIMVIVAVCWMAVAGVITLSVGRAGGRRFPREAETS